MSPLLPKARALIVEDEPEIRRFVRLALESDGWEVAESATLQRGLIDAATWRPDLVVLDLGLPDGDGVQLIGELRTWSAAPVIVLSARDGEADKVRALDAGADDYLIKPFSVAELLARSRAQLRRHQAAGGAAESVTQIGPLQIDHGHRRVLRAGNELHLTPIEYRLLTLLAAQADRVLTHRQLLKELWGPNHGDDVHYLRVHVANLRKKIEDDPARPNWLITEAGVGYRLRSS